jgi:hypothetical protein
MHIIEGTKKSALSRSSSTGGGGLRSTHYIILLIYMYFCIGHDGKILSTGSTNKRKKNDKSDDTSYDKNNHQKIVLEAIEAVLSAYFMTMSSSFTVNQKNSTNVHPASH